MLSSGSHIATTKYCPKEKIIPSTNLTSVFVVVGGLLPPCNVGGPLLDAYRQTKILRGWSHQHCFLGGAGGLGARRRLKLSLLLGWPSKISGFMFAARPKAGSISQHVSDDVQILTWVREDLVQGEDRSSVCWWVNMNLNVLFCLQHEKRRGVKVYDPTSFNWRSTLSFHLLSAVRFLLH